MKYFKDWVNELIPSPPSKLIIRADGGRVWGLSFGHLARCKVIADFFSQNYGTEILFISKNYPEGIEFLSNYTVRVIPADISTSSEISILYEEIGHSDYWICDLPYPDAQNRVISRGKCIWIEDGLNDTPKGISSCINFHLIALEKDLDPNIQYFLGPEYYIENPEPPQKLNGMKSVLFTFGGSDPSGLTLKTLLAVSKINHTGYSYTFHLGPGFHDPTSFIETHRSHDINFLVNPVNLKPHYSQYSLIVCSGGNTLYELYRRQLNIFVISSIEHESFTITQFLKKNLLLESLLEWNETDFTVKFLRALNHINPTEIN